MGACMKMGRGAELNRRIWTGLSLILLLLNCCMLSDATRNKHSRRNRYEWGRVYEDNIPFGNMKAICFDEGSTHCVKYSFVSNTPTLGFVADRSWTSEALGGIDEVRYLEGSICTGLNCTNVEIIVSSTKSYCVLFLNRANKIPSFNPQLESSVKIHFMVTGCTGGPHGILYIVVIIIMMLALMGCCVGAAFHFRRWRNMTVSNEQSSNERRDGQDSTRGNTSNRPSGTPLVVFLEAKI